MANLRTRSCAIIAALVLPVLARPANAQPIAPPSGAPEPPPVVATDVPEVAEAYDAAFTALIAGDLDAAIRGFEMVAARSVVAERRGAAAELLRFARELRARGVKLAPSAGADAGKKATADEDPDAGRTTFIASTTMASFYSGFVLLDLLDIDDFRSGVLVVTGTTAAGFLGSLYGSRGRSITAGMGDAYTLGLGLGVSNALLLAKPLGFTDEREDFLSFALGGLAAGGAVGMFLGDRSRPTQAQVSVTGTLSLMGYATAGLGLGIVQPDDLDSDEFLIVMAAGLDGGALAGTLMAPKLNWSLSRARLVGLGVFLGGLSGWASAALITGADTSSDEGTARFWSAATLGGVWAGFGASYYLTRNMKPDRRYRAEAGPPKRDVMVMPTVVKDAPGFAVAGYF